MSTINKLLKDLARIAIGFGIMFIFVRISSGGPLDGPDYFGCWLCSGVAIGWSISDNIFRAYGLVSLLIKFLLSVLIGVFATPVILLKDIFNVIIELSGRATVTD